MAVRTRFPLDGELRKYRIMVRRRCVEATVEPFIVAQDYGKMNLGLEMGFDDGFLEVASESNLREFASIPNLPFEKLEFAYCRETHPPLSSGFWPLMSKIPRLSRLAISGLNTSELFPDLLDSFADLPGRLEIEIYGCDMYLPSTTQCDNITGAL